MSSSDKSSFRALLQFHQHSPGVAGQAYVMLLSMNSSFCCQLFVASPPVFAWEAARALGTFPYSLLSSLWQMWGRFSSVSPVCALEAPGDFWQIVGGSGRTKSPWCFRGHEWTSSLWMSLSGFNKKSFLFQVKFGVFISSWAEGLWPSVYRVVYLTQFIPLLGDQGKRLSTVCLIGSMLL